MGDTAELFVRPDGYVGLNPIGDGRTNVALVIPRARAGGARGRVEAFFLEQLGRFGPVARRIEPGRLVRPVLATGPFAARSGRVVAGGAALVGDAADFFDPFTGEGIYSALRGAELLAGVALPALERGGPVRARDLSPYRTARRRAFAGKWAVERLIGYGMLFPRLFDRAVARLTEPGLYLADVGGAGAVVPVNAGRPDTSNLARTSLSDAEVAAGADLTGTGTVWWPYAVVVAFVLVSVEWWTWQRRITV